MPENRTGLAVPLGTLREQIAAAIAQVKAHEAPAAVSDSQSSLLYRPTTIRRLSGASACTAASGSSPGAKLTSQRADAFSSQPQPLAPNPSPRFALDLAAFAEESQGLLGQRTFPCSPAGLGAKVMDDGLEVIEHARAARQRSAGGRCTGPPAFVQTESCVVCVRRQASATHALGTVS